VAGEVDLHPIIRLHLERQRGGRDPSQVRVLDFGCGRARWAVGLLDLGYDLRGVDISERELEYGRAALERAGHDPNRLRAIDASGQFPLPDGWADFTFSEEVFEHVADLGSAVAELARMTAVGGEGIHTFPAKWRPMEGHFHAPLIHWLPKNNSRRAAIHLLNLIRPLRPPELPPDAPRRVRAEFKYRYSIEETFYRSHSELFATFRAHGLEVESRLWEHPRLEALVPTESVRRLLDAPLRTFTREVIWTRRPRRAWAGEE
jgi:SAM-dependent methyltransferase